MNDHIENKISGLYQAAFKSADTMKDKDLINSLFATVTGAKFVAKLSGVQNKSSVMDSKTICKEKRISAATLR